MKNEVDEQVRKMTIAVDEKDVKVQDLKSQLLEKENVLAELHEVTKENKTKYMADLKVKTQRVNDLEVAVVTLNEKIALMQTTFDTQLENLVQSSKIDSEKAQNILIEKINHWIKRIYC